MKFLIALLVVILVASNGYWLYHEVDRGITQTYQAQERYEIASRLVATSVIASEVVRDRPKEEAEALLRRLFPGEQVFEKEGALRTIWLSLPLTPQGRVSGVAVDPEAQRQSEAKVRGVVGNEVFWPKK
jgi:hypothetical protein